MGLGWGEVKMEKEEKMNTGRNRWFLVAYSLEGERDAHRVTYITVSTMVKDAPKCILKHLLLDQNREPELCLGDLGRDLQTFELDFDKL